MGIDASLVFDKGLVAGLVPLYPVADELAEGGVFGVCAVELVGEGAEETVAVAEGGGGIEAEGAELVVEALGGLGGVAEGEELLEAREAGGRVRDRRRKRKRKELTLPREDRVVRALTGDRLLDTPAENRATYAADCACGGGGPYGRQSQPTAFLCQHPPYPSP
jgi:hypothetical protein